MSLLSTRLIDGQFPNYRQLLPESYEHDVRLPRSELLDVDPPGQPAGAAQRAAAAGVLRGRADGLGRDAGRRRRARDDAGGVRGRAAGDRLQPRVPHGRARERRGRRGGAALISPLRPGLLRAGRRRRLPLPGDADPAQRLTARSRARRRGRSAPLRNLERGARSSSAARSPSRHRPQRRRQDEPARGALLRPHRPLVPRPATTAT